MDPKVVPEKLVLAETESKLVFLLKVGFKRLHEHFLVSDLFYFKLNLFHFIFNYKMQVNVMFKHMISSNIYNLSNFKTLVLLMNVVNFLWFMIHRDLIEK